MAESIAGKSSMTLFYLTPKFPLRRIYALLEKGTFKSGHDLSYIHPRARDRAR